MGDTVHIVKQGESLASIAFEYGFTWEKLWEYNKDTTLKERQNPNLLLPGDEVQIPDKKSDGQKIEGNTHTLFRVQGCPTVSFKLQTEENDITGFSASADFYTADGLYASMDSITAEIESDGTFTMKVPLYATSADLTLQHLDYGKLRYKILLRQLDPIIDEDLTIDQRKSAAIQRLSNLGYQCESDEQFDAAVKEFKIQHMEQSDPSSDFNESTWTKLASVHGS